MCLCFFFVYAVSVTHAGHLANEHTKVTVVAAGRNNQMFVFFGVAAEVGRNFSATHR